MENDLPEVRRLLRNIRAFPRKSLGQNYLVDRSLVDKIVDAAEIRNDDTILEIGPGLGVLTGALVDRAGKVIAVEIDNKIAAMLVKKFAHCANLKIINADILQLDLSAILREHTEYKVVSNLPYSITSPVLNYFIDAVFKPKLMVLMLQKEVACSIAAKSGNFTALALSLRLFYEVDVLMHVPRTSFYPVPKVDSAIVRITLRDNLSLHNVDYREFIEFLYRGFRAPRKQLCNSLALGTNLPKVQIESILHNVGIDLTRRPEDLDIHEWYAIYKELKRGILKNNVSS